MYVYTHMCIYMYMYTHRRLTALGSSRSTVSPGDHMSNLVS